MGDVLGVVLLAFGFLVVTALCVLGSRRLAPKASRDHAASKAAHAAATARREGMKTQAFGPQGQQPNSPGGL